MDQINFFFKGLRESLTLPAMKALKATLDTSPRLLGAMKLSPAIWIPAHDNLDIPCKKLLDQSTLLTNYSNQQ